MVVYHMLQNSQPTSSSVERSFSMLKNCWPRTEILGRECATLRDFTL